MESQRNKITFDFTNSPELKAIFSSWKTGESYELKIGFRLDEMTNDGAVCTVEEITNTDAGETEKPVEPDMDHPVMAVMSAGPSGETEPVVAP